MNDKAPRRPACMWQRWARGALLALGLWLAGTSPPATADTITSARYIEPTTRYPHGVLGDNIEYSALELTVENTPPNNTLGADTVVKPTVLTVRLPMDRVFEDLAPRLADIDLNGSFEVIVVESHADKGAQLAIYDAGGLKIAATPHIGTPFRWLAPIAAADMDRDGHVEISYIDRPHLAKTLRIWRFENGALSEIATLPDLTNHRIGEDFISGGLRNCGTHPELVLASGNWSRIISVSYRNGWQKSDLGPLNNHDALNSALTC